MINKIAKRNSLLKMTIIEILLVIIPRKTKPILKVLIPNKTVLKARHVLER